MKKSIVALSPVIIFAVFAPFLAATGISRSSGVLILSLGSPIAVLFSYFLFGKRDFQSALYGTALSLLLMACSTWVICLVRSAEFFLPDFSIQYVSAIMAVSLMAAVGEEFVFRGAVFGLLLKYFSRFPLGLLLAVQALLFTASHPAKNHSFMFFVVTFFGGIFLGWAAYRTKSLWFSIGFHFGWDLASVFLTGFHSRNFGLLKATIVFDANYAGVNDVVRLLAVGTGALVWQNFFSIRSEGRGQFWQPAK